MNTLPPSLIAGLLLAAIPLLSALNLPAPTASAVLEAAGASRTTAYKVKAEVEAALPGLLRPPGRPAAPPPETPPDLCPLLHAVRDFVFNHPGAVGGTAERRRYSDRFRLFVLDQWDAHRDIGPEALAEAVGVPLPTLKDWLRGERPQVEAPVNLATIPGPAPARIQTVLDGWDRWADKKRGFRAFCEHVWFHLRVPFGRQHIKDILQAHGVRIPTKRGRPPDASANRGGFQTFHPGAQWVGDGAELVVMLNGQRFTVNLELLVDADSGAFTGASIRPTEDAAAVTEAFADGVRTTGAPPVALLLDNKPSNHGEEVDQALGDTLRIRSRPFVPTDKPHVEGAFGLFAQEGPPMTVIAATPEALAAEIARLVVSAWSVQTGAASSTSAPAPIATARPTPSSTATPNRLPRRSHRPAQPWRSVAESRTRPERSGAGGRIPSSARFSTPPSPASDSTRSEGRPRRAPPRRHRCLAARSRGQWDRGLRGQEEGRHAPRGRRRTLPPRHRQEPRPGGRGLAHRRSLAPRAPRCRTGATSPWPTSNATRTPSRKTIPSPST